MVDSEIPVRAKRVSRRTMLMGGLAAPFIPPLPGAGSGQTPDPVLALWTAWRRASAEEEALGAHWAALETRLAREVGFPRVAVPVPDSETPVWTTTHAGIDAALERQEDARMGPHLHAELARREALWADAAVGRGLDAADRRTDAAASRSLELAEALMRLPAATLPGAIVKLELILRTGQSQSGDEDFPWGWLRAAIDDFKRLHAGPAELA